ncbi:PhzF family phenazine biosynthesis protein [Gallaecimonas xiamenensis]|uniref:PhzF family phenazine biosynthesis protein n=1 Tax=Gallaecimonas xiamenensis 3-C-1 TaxID=745411 RepID=K2K0F3_9GAMM|nr:PhzF family phenazine biosynthesis protein [Gallaecimonas xiamenensis]EKE76194.1 PhzF family phenazine biosynthesis protein [Gallaecimonas xiamenensis 3-C-1]
MALSPLKSPTSCQVHLVRAFTWRGQGGNGAGVVLDAGELSEAQMQALAQQVGLSETAFISASNKADFAVRFFTPTEEVDFCGHATLAVFSLLHQSGRLGPGHYRQETKAGVLGVRIDADGQVVMDQCLPQFMAQHSAELLAPMLGLVPADIGLPGLPIQALSTGLRDLMVPVAKGGLDKARPRYRAISDFCRQQGLVGFHLFEAPSQGEVRCRNFAPLVGIDEESATGSACGALAAYLAHYQPGLPNPLTMVQGQAMGQGSRLDTWVEKRDGAISAVRVGGRAAVYDQTQLAVETC